MDCERIAHIFFFGFLAVMGYELYLLLSPFLVPIVWAMLLAFITTGAPPTGARRSQPYGRGADSYL